MNNEEVKKLLKGAEENGVLAFTNLLLSKCVGNIHLLNFEEIVKLSEEFIEDLKK